MMGCRGSALCCSEEADEGTDGEYHLNSDVYIRRVQPRFDTWQPYETSNLDVVQELCRGHTCKMYLVKHRPTHVVAVMKELTRISEANKEFKVSAISLKSKQIISHLGCFKESTPEASVNSKFYILLQYAPFKNLATLSSATHGLGSDKARFYAFEIAKGLEYLHSNGVIHRDVKPENVFILHSGHVAIGDFGISHFLADNPVAEGLCGSFVIRPPEVWDGVPYGKSVDIWMFGNTLWNLITNKYPFFHADREVQKRAVSDPKLTFTAKFNKPATDLIQKLIEKVPDKRLKIEEVLKHDYFESAKDTDKPPYPRESLIELYTKNSLLKSDEYGLVSSLLQTGDKLAPSPWANKVNSQTSLCSATTSNRTQKKSNSSFASSLKSSKTK